MEKISALLVAAMFGFGLGGQEVHADSRQNQIKKLRVQADQAHKKGDALTAKADQLASGPDTKKRGKMRGCDYNNGPSCVVKAGGQRPSPDVVHKPPTNVNNGPRK